MNFSDICIILSIKFSFENHILHIFFDPIDVSAFKLKKKILPYSDKDLQGFSNSFEIWSAEFNSFKLFKR